MSTKSIVALCVLTWMASCTALDSIALKGNWGWNELLRAKGIFDTHLNDIKTKSSQELVVLDQLDQLLSAPNALENLYRNYKLLFPKTLSAMDYSSRLEVFGKELKVIARHNLKAHRGETTWVMGVNQFTDMTNEEFRSMHSLNATAMDESMKRSGKEMKGLPENIINIKDVPDAWDWRDSGIISPPLDQNPCGTCGIFSSLAQLEAIVAMTKKTSPVHLSVQEIMDCGQKTCSDGASPNDVWDYIASVGGVGPESAYPYEAKDTNNCRSAGIDNIANVASNYYKNQVKERTIKKFVFKAPTATYIYMSQKHYDSGIIMGSDCGDNEYNHAVLLVGYGSENGQKYWIIKNSWGATWGEKGFFRLERNFYAVPGACQIGNAVFFLTLADPK